MKMHGEIALLPIPNAADRLVTVEGRRSLELFFTPLTHLPGIQAEVAGTFTHGDELYALRRFGFRGPNSGDPIRLAIFGALHGDEPAGALAAADFMTQLAADPGLAQNFFVQAYPICNPSGFEDNTRHSRRGRDLNREFWRNSDEPEVRLIENELRTGRFHGMVQLHADDTSDGIYGFVRGHTLTEYLLRPALAAAGEILPRNVRATIDGFAARDGIIRENYDGILAAPAEIDPTPFEIVLETPQHAPLEKQVQALAVALRTIITEYRRLISFAADL